nr:ferredoxin [Clostridioides sp.]
MRAFVDKDTCIGCGACVGICPEVFHTEDDGKLKAIEEDLSSELQDSARDAADYCPVVAICIEE